jgi:hypothetical protein
MRENLEGSEGAEFFIPNACNPLKRFISKK